MVVGGKLVEEKVGRIEKGVYLFIPADVEPGPEDLPEGCVLFINFNIPLGSH